MKQTAAGIHSSILADWYHYTATTAAGLSQQTGGGSIRCFSCISAALTKENQCKRLGEEGVAYRWLYAQYGFCRLTAFQSD